TGQPTVSSLPQNLHSSRKLIKIIDLSGSIKTATQNNVNSFLCPAESKNIGPRINVTVSKSRESPRRFDRSREKSSVFNVQSHRFFQHLETFHESQLVALPFLAECHHFRVSAWVCCEHARRIETRQCTSARKPPMLSFRNLASTGFGAAPAVCPHTDGIGSNLI